MEEELKSGTSINNHRPSELDTITSHGISRVLEEPTTCKSGLPILDGSKYSCSKVSTLSTQPTIRSLKSKTKRMRKVKQSLSTQEMVIRTTMPTKDGRSSMLIKLKSSELRVSTKSLVSISTDHSISDQECQCKELPNAMEPTTFG